MEIIFGLCAFLICLLWLSPFWKSALRRGKYIVVFTALGFSIFAGLLYHHLGAPEIARQVINDTHQRDDQQRSARTLEKELEQHPENPDLWARLGQTYYDLAYYKQAVEALREAVKRSEGKRPEWILSFAKAQMLESGGLVTPNAARSFAVAHEMMPENQEASVFLGVAYRQAGEMNKAKALLDSVLHNSGSSPEIQAIAERNLSLIKEQDGESGASDRN